MKIDRKQINNIVESVIQHLTEAANNDGQDQIEEPNAKRDAQLKTGTSKDTQKQVEDEEDVVDYPDKKYLTGMVNKFSEFIKKEYDIEYEDNWRLGELWAVLGFYVEDLSDKRSKAIREFIINLMNG